MTEMQERFIFFHYKRWFSTKKMHFQRVFIPLFECFLGSKKDE